MANAVPLAEIQAGSSGSSRLAGIGTFRVLETDVSLLPMLIRWAQSDGLVVVLDGRRVTTKSLRESPYLDLPLTPEARLAIGTTAEEAIDAALKTYRSYRSNVEVAAVFKPPYFLSITTKRTIPLVESVAPPQSPQTSPQNLPAPQTPKQVPPQLATAPKEARPRAAAPTPAPVPVAASGSTTNAPAAVTPVPTWDAAARKSAGVMPAMWVVGDSTSLRSVVEVWARQSGHQVEWISRHDYQITDAVRTTRYIGTFREALMQLAGSFGRLDTPLGMSFAQTGGRPVLRVFDL